MKSNVNPAWTKAANFSQKDCENELLFLMAGGEFDTDLAKTITKELWIDLVKLKLSVAWGVKW